ncbi:baculoviral IAP repeat-containing protein 3 [Phoca vitulina]|uniref:baculoviral IAP repeat-containing protein 3 n=1 Tax=Phoca vitulina TaxID=9720 RepID=UPI001395E55C|nr:baculoviral IAP repeat-containing protein 3 [Phoca vitulina]XP_032283593.1 baculoviral IAP repeat-containing protein 3 [Phoca vitulina]XP_032283594.1 baculoviral IAP repeat-containing protein 3 [Phoca vitulina]XP_032283595.1 baculoviral IAP repeat-containing protein 3 [Phoca vitulina]XP_032283596.1 baculoviral IAP repeat-containing protein 3 [Phoca vitulina]XP_032283597.1 baculoviral IAP repeat-containing protein 3 [Phoca vitulina]XP_032283599.1 baculoviral IAP repeat-containing protein 3 
MNIVQNSLFLSNLLKSTPVLELKYDHSCELYRMSTYSAFPAGVPISERSLARAGFYYTGVNDKVRCFCCGLMLDNWRPGDHPAEKHKQLYPSCAFIQNLNSARVSGASSPPPPPCSVTNSTHPLPPSLENTGYFSGSYSSFPSNPVNFRPNQEFAPWRPSPYDGAVKTVEARLLTFQTWPLTSPQAPELARAGFYYVGPGDRVACFACGGKLSNWEPNDNALSEHLRHFPDCPFVESQLQDVLRPTVSNVSMQTHVARLRTFCSWPSHVPVRPEQLATAGFYYTGHSDDVKCFCCDGGLRCWESGDDPWVEHAKWFPRCEYLIHIKGQEFISQIQASYPHLLEQLLSTSDNTEDENAESPIVHFGPGENRSEDAVMMNTPVVKAALEMGFSRSLVRQTVQSKILTTGENYRTVNDIVSDLLHAEDEIKEEEKERAAENRESDDVALIRKNRMVLFQHLTYVLPILDSLLTAGVISEQEHSVIKQKAQTSLQVRELIDTVLVKGSFAVTIFKNSLQETDPVLYKRFFVQQDIKYIPPENVSDLPVEEQLRRLQEERTCKVCMDKEVSIVFIPCGHLVVCRDCAPSLRRCPICRGPVKGTVRTFLS